MEKGYTQAVWLTYKQAQASGGQVKKGEKGSLVVYANTFDKVETDDSGKETTQKIPFLKGYTVFNVEQIDGLPQDFYQPVEVPQADQESRLDRVEQFVAHTKAMVNHGGNRAFYHSTQDYIQIPPFPNFQDQESYYATLAHELVHWTSHAT